MSHDACAVAEPAAWTRSPAPPADDAVPRNFDQVVLPHLDAAYRLARWLLSRDEDAEDAVQEAALRALRYFDTFVGGNERAWFLRIVRNTCYGWRAHHDAWTMDSFDEERHSSEGASDPEALVLRADAVAAVDRVLAALPRPMRELLALRELEGLSYRELAGVFGIPVGTVMSRLSRARQAFRRALEATLAHAS